MIKCFGLQLSMFFLFFCFFNDATNNLTKVDAFSFQLLTKMWTMMITFIFSAIRGSTSRPRCTETTSRTAEPKSVGGISSSPDALDEKLTAGFF